MFNFSLPGRGMITGKPTEAPASADQRAATRAGRLFLRVALWQHVTMTAFGFGIAKGQQMAPVTRVGVTVTFLRMDRAPRQAAPGLAPDTKRCERGRRRSASTVICTTASGRTIHGGRAVWRKTKSWRGCSGIRRSASIRFTPMANPQASSNSTRAPGGCQFELFRPDASVGRHWHRLRVPLSRG